MSIQNYSDNIKNTVKLIKESDYILIGAGAGLSASGGLDYSNRDLFKEWFPRLSQEGIETIGEAISTYWHVNDENRRAFWAYWANHIQKIRYQAPALQPYLDLFDIVKDKNYFIITTNVDGQFEKAGFNKDKIFAPQGDYCLFQCDQPCSNEVYDNHILVDKMVADMDANEFIIQESDIPHCPRCGSFMTKNLRMDNTFVGTPHMKKQKNYYDFINHSENGQLTLIELGVGFNTPGIIRFPFEEITTRHPKAELIRINTDYSNASEEIALKCICIKSDSMKALTDIKRIYNEVTKCPPPR